MLSDPVAGIPLHLAFWLQHVLALFQNCLMNAHCRAVWHAGDFSGGTFQTLEADGHLKPYQFELGDALVFVSHKYHCVAPVTAGRRRVLVTELFSGGGAASSEEGEGDAASN